jgi:hypothetical protein
MNRFLVILMLFVCFAARGQNKQKHLANFTVNGSFCIPNILSSEMFRVSFDGIMESNLSVSAETGENFFIGLGYQNVLFQNDQNLKYAYFNASIPYDTRLIGNGIFARFSYVRFFSDIGFMSYALNGGYMLSHYTRVNNDTSKANQPFVPQEFNAPYIQPEVGVNFIVDKTISFAVQLSYTTLFTHFDPKAPRFNQFEEIATASNNYLMSWFNIGFGFKVLLNKRKKK